MIIQRYQCDGKDCVRYTQEEEEFMDNWIDVWVGVEQYVFCSGWCMTKWGANQFEPTEVL